MDYYVNGGVWNGVPGIGSFSLVTPTVGGVGLPSPTGYWTYNVIPVSNGNIQELVGYVGVTLAPNSSVSFPIDVEDDDNAALTPEPGSFFLLGAGLVAVGMIRRKRAAR